MIRGLISGLFWGAVFAFLILAGASLLGKYVPGGAAPEQAAVEVPAGSSFDRDAPEGPAEIPDTDATVAVTDAPKVSEPEAETETPLADTTTAVQPETTGEAPANPLDAPEPVESPGSIALGQDQPVLPTPQAEAPEAPALDVTPAAPEEAPSAEAEVEVAEEAEPEAAPEPAPAPEAPASANVPTIPAIKAFAIPFENTRAQPVMSVVLLDGDERPTPDQLAAFPFPLTFVIDPTSPTAGAAMRLYRDAGFEVAMLVNLPQGAEPSDAEVAFQAYMSEVPEAVAVLDAVDSGFQSNRDMVAQVVEILKESGHGLVTYSRGLNTARQVAQREGVPANVVFRDFDGKGEAPVVMRRFLDQAAFRAGQEEGVILVGRAKPDTIGALVDWALQGSRASTVALAPLSVALTGQ